MLVMTKDRFFLKLEISPKVRTEFERLYKKRGLTQIEAATRLFRWFLSQDEMVQQAIFQQLPGKLSGEARRMLVEGIVPLTLSIPLDAAQTAAEDSALDEEVEDLKGKVRKQKGA